MSTFQRVVAMIVMILCVVLALVSVAGVIGTWIVRAELSTSLVNLLEVAEEALTTTSNGLSELDSGLTSVSSGISKLEDEVLGVGVEFVENPVILDSIETILEVDLKTPLNDIVATVQAIRDAAVNIQSAIVAINAIPFVNLDQYLSEEPGLLERLVNSIDSTAEAVDQLISDTQDAKADVAELAVTAVTEKTQKVDGFVGEVQSATVEIGTAVDEINGQVIDLQRKVPIWLTIAAIAMTLFLLWLIFSQIVLFLVGLSVWRGENMLARWIPEKKQLESAASE